MRSFFMLISIVAAVHAADFNQRSKFDPELFNMLKRNEQADRQQTIEELMQDEQFSKLNRNIRASELMTIDPEFLDILRRNQREEQMTLDELKTLPEIKKFFTQELVNTARSVLPIEQANELGSEVMKFVKNQASKFDIEQLKQIPGLLNLLQIAKKSEERVRRAARMNPELWAMLQQNQLNEQLAIDEIVKDSRFSPFFAQKQQEQTKNSNDISVEPELLNILESDKISNEVKLSLIKDDPRFKRMFAIPQQEPQELNMSPELFALLQENAKKEQLTIDQMKDDARFAKFVSNKEPTVKRIKRVAELTTEKMMEQRTTPKVTMQTQNALKQTLNVEATTPKNMATTTVETTKSAVENKVPEIKEETTPKKMLTKREIQQMDPSILAILRANQFSEQLTLEEMKEDARFAKFFESDNSNANAAATETMKMPSQMEVFNMQMDPKLLSLMRMNLNKINNVEEPVTTKTTVKHKPQKIVGRFSTAQLMI